MEQVSKFFSLRDLVHVEQVSKFFSSRDLVHAEQVEEVAVCLRECFYLRDLVHVA